MDNNYNKLKHDIRSDLNSIFNAIELIQDEKIEQQQIHKILKLILDKKIPLESNIEQLIKTIS